MNFDDILGFLAPLMLIFLGIMIKYSYNDGWSSSKKYWPYLFFGGILLLILKICKYWLL